MRALNSLLETLSTCLGGLGSRRFIVAFSGGLDSHVLLHSLAIWLGTDRSRVTALHVDHGLQPGSKAWARHCMASAAALDIAYELATISQSPTPGASVEAWARRERYALLKSSMQPHDVLLTAHHRDDLAETLLLQLLRGAGPHGLASIPESQQFGPGLLIRPFIHTPREALAQSARQCGLDWIEDPSNSSTRHDRNYLRQQVLPVIESRWPSAKKRLAHAAQLQQQTATSLDRIADEVLNTIATPNGYELSVLPLLDLADNLQRWVLRRWIKRVGYPIPDAVHLVELQRCITARPDAIPCVSWKGVEARRYRDRLYLMRRQIRVDPTAEYPWDFARPLHLADGVLRAEKGIGRGISTVALNKRVAYVRYRRGGERCHPSERAHSQSLKRLFQQWGIEPWRRESMPLVYVASELVAVSNICVCKSFAAGDAEQGWVLHWSPRYEPNMPGDS